MPLLLLELKVQVNIMVDYSKSDNFGVMVIKVTADTVIYCNGAIIDADSECIGLNGAYTYIIQIPLNSKVKIEYGDEESFSVVKFGDVDASYIDEETFNSEFRMPYYVECVIE